MRTEGYVRPSPAAGTLANISEPITGTWASRMVVLYFIHSCILLPLLGRFSSLHRRPAAGPQRTAKDSYKVGLCSQQRGTLMVNDNIELTFVLYQSVENHLNCSFHLLDLSILCTIEVQLMTPLRRCVTGRGPRRTRTCVNEVDWGK